MAKKTRTLSVLYYFFIFTSLWHLEGPSSLPPSLPPLAKINKMNSRVQVLPGHRTSQLTPEKRKLDPENLLENLLCNFCSSQKAELDRGVLLSKSLKFTTNKIYKALK